MNFSLRSDRDILVDAFFTFTGGKQWTVRVLLEKDQEFVHTIVGRWPKDLVSMELEYDGHRRKYPIILEGENFKTIYLSPGRDYWSQMLRNKAMDERHGNN